MECSERYLNYIKRVGKTTLRSSSMRTTVRVHDSTGNSPFYLMFGRSPRLPIDLAFNLQKTNDPTDYPQYVAKWKTAMQETYTKASAAANKNAAGGKKHYDKKIRSSLLQPGDRVLVRNLSQRGGPGKLRAYWEERVHVVKSRKGPDSPVYEVQSESKASKPHTLHRNLLLPCDHLSNEAEKPKSRQHKNHNPQDNLHLSEMIPRVKLQTHLMMKRVS